MLVVADGTGWTDESKAAYSEKGYQKIYITSSPSRAFVQLSALTLHMLIEPQVASARPRDTALNIDMRERHFSAGPSHNAFHPDKGIYSTYFAPEANPDSR